MDKQFVLQTLQERQEIVEARYKCYCNQENEFGEKLTYASAAYYRSQYKQEIRMLKLIKELLLVHTKGELALSEDAIDGLERLMMPIERHRRLKK